MSSHALKSWCDWLAATAASQRIQSTEWIIPATQTVHILAVAAVLTSALIIDLRLLGLLWRDQPVDAVIRRLAPFIWWPLPLLAATGSTLIVAEPARALLNPVFYLKMGLLVAAAGVTLSCQMPLRRDARFWERSTARYRGARLMALASLPLWVGVVFAGRWIAYVQGS